MKIELNNDTGALTLTPEDDRELRFTNLFHTCSRDSIMSGMSVSDAEDEATVIIHLEHDNETS